MKPVWVIRCSCFLGKFDGKKKKSPKIVDKRMRRVKYIFFLFNLILVLAGSGLIATGARVVIGLNEYFFNYNYMGPAVSLIVVGILMMPLAVFGCCGAYKENYSLIKKFAIFLGVVLAMELAVSIIGFALTKEIDETIEGRLKKTVMKFGFLRSVTQNWLKLQFRFQCCGVNDALDWRNVTEFEQQPPSGCCPDGQDYYGCKYEMVTRRGCKEELAAFIKGKVVLVGAVGIGLAIVPIAGILLACHVAKVIRKTHHVTN